MDYKILGTDHQTVKIRLYPNEYIIAEPGALVYMENGIHMEAFAGEGRLFSKVTGMLKRSIAGESVFLVKFINKVDIPRELMMTGSFLSKIIPIKKDEFPEGIICQKGAFMAGTSGTDVTYTVVKKTLTGLFGGEGFVLQKVKTDDTAFISASGTVYSIDLNGTIKVEAGCLVAFDPSIEFSVELLSLKSALFGGEGLFLATLSGTGRVIIQSTSEKKTSNIMYAGCPYRDK